MKKWIIISIISFTLVSCHTSNDNSKVSQTTPTDTESVNVNVLHFLNPYLLPYLLEESGTEYIPFMFGQIGNIHKANYYVKNGRLPNNISEKFTYLFDEKHQLRKAVHFSDLTYSQPYSDFEIHYNPNGLLKKMYVVEYMSMLNQPPVTYVVDTSETLIIQQVTAQQRDTIVIIPSANEPEIIYKRNNNKTVFFHVFVPKEDYKVATEAIIDQYKTTLNLNDSTSYLLTYINDNQPIKTYELNPDLSLNYKTQEWQYNDNSLPNIYQEFRNGFLIKRLEIQYGKEHLPNYFILNKKEFSTFYENLKSN